VQRLELFPFRYRDPRTGKWVRARYRAERQEIAARYAEYEIVGQAEIREIDPDERRFCPHSAEPAPRPCSESALDIRARPRPDVPALDPGSLCASERFLLLVFLRRYVTWCARSRHHERVRSAAALHRRLC